MTDRTAKLHDLMHDYRVTSQEVADLLGRSVATVYTWRHGSNPIPQQSLILLEMLLKQKNAQLAS